MELVLLTATDFWAILYTYYMNIPYYKVHSTVQINKGMKIANIWRNTLDTAQKLGWEWMFSDGVIYISQFIDVSSQAKPNKIAVCYRYVCNTVWAAKSQPTFRSNMPPPLYRLKRQRSKRSHKEVGRNCYDGGDLFLWNLTEFQRTMYKTLYPKG
jgi:hypothetical protein